MSASELWVVAQRAIPDWARGRMNATVIMISQGAMALGGGDVGFGCRDSRSKFYLARSGDAIRHRLVLSRRLSINAKSNLQERVSGFLSGSAEPEEVTPIALTTELLAA